MVGNSNVVNKLTEEFYHLDKVGEEKPALIGDLPINWSRNRYYNILPFDSTRFKLIPPGEDGSDYINANIVRVSKERAIGLLLKMPK